MSLNIETPTPTCVRSKHHNWPSAQGAIMSLALRVTFIGLILCAVQPSWSQEVAPRVRFSCTNTSGTTIDDREMLDCNGILKKIGPSGVSTVIPTIAQRRILDKCESEKKAAADERRRTASHDNNVLSKYPDEAAHRKARQTALRTTIEAIERSEARLSELAKERKPLMDELEFYQNGKSVPAKLQQKINANDGLIDTQQVFLTTKRAEAARINGQFDEEFGYIKILWSAPPSSPAYQVDCLAVALAQK
jgi:hypothetical protein